MVPTMARERTSTSATVAACEFATSAISINNGMIKIGPAGVSLVNGAMSFGVPP